MPYLVGSLSGWNRLSSATSPRTKLVRAIDVVVLIHALPASQPATLGGANSDCPICTVASASASAETVGERISYARIVPTANSTGLETRRRRMAGLWNSAERRINATGTAVS